MPRSKARQEPTKTSLVERALTSADDFMTLEMVLAACHGAVSRHQGQAALHHLKLHAAVGAMEAEGALWWYATPDTDDRTRQVAQRAPEQVPRKPRRVRKNLIGTLPGG